MKKILYLPLLLLAAEASANGNYSAPMPAPAAEAPKMSSPWGLYAGLSAGGIAMRGHKKLIENIPIIPLVQNRVTNSQARDNAARFDGYLGGSWNIPDTNMVIGLETFGSYADLKNKDTNTVPVIGGGFSTVSTEWSTKYSLGADFRHSYNLSPLDQVYALVGTEYRKFKLGYTDLANRANRSKNAWGFDWGLGYEHRFGNSSFGLRFKQSLFGSTKFKFNVPVNTRDTGTIRPRFYSLMLTYKYNFMG